MVGKIYNQTKDKVEDKLQAQVARKPWTVAVLLAAGVVIGFAIGLVVL